MNFAEILGVGIGIGGLSISVVTMFFKFNGAIKAVEMDAENKRKRLYERFDEYKDAVKNDFTSKEVCNILHQQTANDIQEIKGDLKKLLHKNGIQ